MKAYIFRSSPICILSLQHFVHVFVLFVKKNMEAWVATLLTELTLQTLQWILLVHRSLYAVILIFTANSRSSSPTSRISYLTHTQKDPMTPRSVRRSGATRSQGASREGSPNRVHMQPGRFFIWWTWMEFSGGLNFQASR